MPVAELLVSLRVCALACQIKMLAVHRNGNQPEPSSSQKIPGKKNEDYQNVQSKFKDTSSEVNKLLNEKEKFHQMIDKRKKEASFRKHLG